MDETVGHELASHPMFTGLTGAAARTLAQHAVFENYPSDTELTRQGVPPDDLFVLLSGWVEMSAQHNGNSCIIELASAGAVFPLPAVMRDKHVLAAVKTLGPSRVCKVPAYIARSVASKDIGFARAILDHLGRSEQALTRNLIELKTQDSVARVLNWFLTEAQGNSRVELAFAKSTLASLLGMTPENLSRTFAKLEKHGLSTRGRTIQVADEVRLAVLVRRFSLPGSLARL